MARRVVTMARPSATAYRSCKALSRYWLMPATIRCRAGGLGSEVALEAAFAGSLGGTGVAGEVGRGAGGGGGVTAVFGGCVVLGGDAGGAVVGGVGSDAMGGAAGAAKVKCNTAGGEATSSCRL